MSHCAIKSGLAAVLLAQAGCDGGEPARPPATGSAVWDVGAAEVRIGSVDDPDFAFSSVTALSLGPDGNVYSLHSGDAMVRRWTPDGRPAGTLGGPGEGPGEFRRPQRMGFMGDSLWVWDPRTFRVTYFTPSGEVVATAVPGVDLGAPEADPGLRPIPSRPLRDGSWFASTPGSSREVAQGLLTSGLHARTDVHGEILDTVWIQEWRPTDTWAILTDGGGSFMDQPFGDDPLYHVFEDGGVLVVDRRPPPDPDSPTFGVTRIDPAGDTVFARRVAYSPEALPGTVADSTLDANARTMVDFLNRLTPGSTTLARTREAMATTFYAPRWVPAVNELVVEQDGSAWLRRRLLDPSRNQWWVLDPEGALVATVELPAGFRLRAVDDTALWGTETDDLEVTYVVRYRVSVPAG